MSIKDKNFAVPDFYVVASHGTGLQSFLYYLRLLQLPSTQWWSQDTVFLNLKKQYAYCGFTVDCRLERDEGEPFATFLQQSHAPVFWLMRDPVDLISSVLNQSLGDALLNGYLAQRFAAARQECLSLKNSFASFQRVMCGKNYLPYQSLLRRICNPQNIYIIDVHDLLPDKVISTMERVVSHICQDASVSVASVYDKMSISYNNFSNRAWSFIPPIPICVGSLSFGVRVFPSNIADFFVKNNDRSVHFLCRGKQYSIHFDQSLEKDVMSDICYTAAPQLENSLCGINSSIDEITSIFNDLKVTRAFALQKLRENKTETINFLKMQSGTIHKVQTLTGEYPKNWGTYTSLADSIL